MKPRRAVSRVLLADGLVIALAVVAGCSLFGSDRGGGDDGGDDDRFVQVGHPKTAPSGAYTASLDDGADQNGVATRIVVITDADGEEVFRDDYAYSTRHGVGVTWLSSADQLWILSSDVGTAHVDRQADGTWTKTGITPETKDTIPEDIDQLR
jgi:hypothetical protein